MKAVILAASLAVVLGAAPTFAQGPRTPDDVVRAFVEAINKKDLDAAASLVKGGKADMGAVRHLLSHILNRTYSLMLRLPLRDLSSGFRMYQRNVLVSLNLRARDFDVQEEILVNLYVQGCRIKEVPFHYRVRKAGKSHVKLLRFGWAFSKTLFRLRRLRNSRDIRIGR